MEPLGLVFEAMIAQQGYVIYTLGESCGVLITGLKDLPVPSPARDVVWRELEMVAYPIGRRKEDRSDIRIVTVERFSGELVPGARRLYEVLDVRVGVGFQTSVLMNNVVVVRVKRVKRLRDGVLAIGCEK